jgi:hypothetical protein
MTEKPMLAYQSDQTVSIHKCTSEPTIMDKAYSDYTIASQDDIKKKLMQLFIKNILLTIKVPGKFATSTLLTMITHIEGEYIFLGGFQNEQFNKDLLMQSNLVVAADFEGIAVGFILSGTAGVNIDNTFNLKARLPRSMEWVQRRNARRVKVPMSTPVKIQYNNQAGYFNVADISVVGLSYIDQAQDHRFAAIGRLHTDCTILLPDNSKYLANFEIVNNIIIPYRHSREINRIGCEIKRPSYQLDTALQHLINQIDFLTNKSCN